MPRSNNILQFPSGPLHGLNLKLFTVLFYLFIAGMLTNVFSDGEGGIGFLVLLGFLYHFLLRQRFNSRNYLKQNSFLLIVLFLLALFVFPLTLIPIFAIAIIYWFLIGRSSPDAPYFIRFHLLTALILNFLILISFLLLFAANNFAGQILSLFNIQTLFILDIHTYGFFLLQISFWLVAIWLSLAAILGRTPYIGIVTNNIRYWT
jgi:hypothetical protein